MFIASTILSILFAGALAGSAISKFRKVPAQVELMHTVGLRENWLYALGSLELLAAVGLLVGIFWWPLAVAAAIGTVLYFLGALTSHLRVRDRNLQGAAIMLVAGVAVLVLLLLSQ